MANLTEYSVVELSLVPWGAVGRKFFLTKEDSMDNAKLVEEIMKADFDEKPIEQILKGAGLTEKAQAALKAASRMLNACKMDLPEEMQKSLLPQLAKALDFGMPEVSKAPTKKEDGSFDFEGVDETVKTQVEALWKEKTELEAELAETKKGATDADKALAEIKKSNEDLNAKLNAEIDARVTKEYVAKAAEFKHLAINAEEYGPILKKMAENDKAGYEKQLEILKAADEAQAKLFVESGASGEAEGNAYSVIEKEAVAIMKESKGLTKEQAVAKALEAKPELYEQYRKECN